MGADVSEWRGRVAAVACKFGWQGEKRRRDALTAIPAPGIFMTMSVISLFSYGEWISGRGITVLSSSQGWEKDLYVWTVLPFKSALPH